MMARLGSEHDEWRPNDMYTSLGGSQGSVYTSVSYGAGASSHAGVAQVTTSTSLFRHGSSFSYAHSSAPTSMGTPVKGVAAPSAGMYLTSSAEVRSFGGGNTSAVSASSMSSRSVTSSPIASVNGLSVSSPLASASLPVVGQSMQAPAFIISGMPGGDIAMAASYAGIGQTTAGGPMGISGRHNAPPPAWYGWLLSNAGTFGTGSDGSYGFTYDQLWAAYQEYVNNYWDGGLGQPAPDFNDWLTWLQNQEVGGALYWIATPVGDVWVLLVLAIAYAVFVWLRKRQLA